MSIELSRRDFMKCSAVAVLAAASGSLLTGCGGGGTGGVPAGRTINYQGTTITMGNYNSMLRLGEGYGDFELLKIEFDLHNTGDTAQKISTSVGNIVDDVIKAAALCISTASPDPLKELGNSRNFNVSAEGGKVYAYVDYNDNILPELVPGEDADIVLYCAVSSGWTKLNINYNYLGGVRFIQVRN